MRTAVFCAIVACAAGGAEPFTPARADDAPITIVVLKEHGVGGPTLAQPYLDRFVALAAKENGWRAASGQYHTNRSSAEAFIHAQQPHYGILSLAAFLALRGKYRLDVVGQVAVSLAGGRQYHVISKRAANLADCKGKAFASDHTDDVRFIERVVAAGQFTLRDFTLAQTQRPLQTIKKVVGGEADCALIDEAQLAELAHLDGAGGVRAVWKSAELPPMAVVAFPAASLAERRTFQDNIAKLCENDGQTACAEVGIVSLTAAGDQDYAAVIAAYGP